MQTDEIRTKAIEETKRGGDPAKAVALALIVLGDRLAEHADAGSDGASTVGEAIVTAGRDLEAQLGAIAGAGVGS